LIAEIVTIGTELLLGEIVDSNAAHIARELALVGIDHYITTTVGDNEARITRILRQALARSDVVITTGGLGPTVDDVTREAAARATGRVLGTRPELLEQIEAFFRGRGYPMTENNRRQACLPQGAIAIENPVGTAPSFIVEVGEKVLVCLPGVPHEMEYLLRARVLPYLSQRMGAGAVILGRWVHTVAIGESTVGQAIDDLMQSSNPTVGTRAHPGQTDVCITAKADTEQQARQLLDEMEKKVRDRLGAVVYGTDGQTLPQVVVDRLLAQRHTLALAETNTGGRVARDLLATPGGREAVVGVRVALDSEMLAQQMGLSTEGGPEALAETVASALRACYDTHLSLAMIEASEEGATSYIALASAQGVKTRTWPSRGHLEYANERSAHYALDLVRRWLMANA
jgi:nicotinamide-nucleotide amidase